MGGGDLNSLWKRQTLRCLQGKVSFGWVGDTAAKDLGVYEKDFCPTIAQPVVPLGMIENMMVDLKVLQIKGKYKMQTWWESFVNMQGVATSNMCKFLQMDQKIQ